MMAEGAVEVEERVVHLDISEDDARALHRALVARWMVLDDRDGFGPVSDPEYQRVARMVARVAAKIWDTAEEQQANLNRVLAGRDGL